MTIGLAVTVTLIGILLAAATGIIGASVVLLGLLALPGQGYRNSLAVGTVCASGTLGILIPPSIMLVMMADQLALSAGDLFMGALLPGVLPGILYIIYILVYSFFVPDAAPLAPNRKLNLKVFREVLQDTFNTTGYIFGILVGATCFALVLRELGGDEFIAAAFTGLPFGPYGIITVILLLVFGLGFFLDWIEITLIILPILSPVVSGLGLSIDGAGGVCHILPQGGLPAGDRAHGHLPGRGSLYHPPAHRPVHCHGLSQPGDLAAGNGLWIRRSESANLRPSKT